MAARRQADTGDGSEDPSQAQPALRTRSGKGEGRQLPLRVEEGGRASPSKPARRLVETPPQREDLLDLGLTLEDLPTPLRRVERSKVVLESEDFLEETAGLLNLSPDAFPRALRSRLLRVEKNRPDEPIVQFLLSTGIDRHDLNEMLEAYPRLLKVKVTDALQQKVDFLFVQLKMGPEELVEFPQYLTYDLNTRIHPRHAFLSITRLRERAGRGGPDGRRHASDIKLAVQLAPEEAPFVQIERVCAVCARQISKYACPRCNIRYCSIQCYKAVACPSLRTNRLRQVSRANAQMTLQLARYWKFCVECRSMTRTARMQRMTKAASKKMC
eukprot:tig00000704_g3345.t2